jgi:hypothetical protein
MGVLLSSSARAYPIRVNFTVLGSLSDPYTANATSTGYFTFDSGLIPYGGGAISANYPPGIEFSKMSFTWAGHTWTESDAFVNILYFDPDGSLTGFSIQAKVTPGTVNGDIFPDFAIDVHVSETFTYSSPARTSAYAGLVMSWDAAKVAIIVSAWQGPGWQIAIDSFGRAYKYIEPYSGTLGSVTTYNLFGGPPSSRVVDAGVGTNDHIYAILENGDVWRIVDEPVGVLCGNIFSAPGVTSVGQESPRRANAFLHNRPNPFNPDTEIPYRLASSGRVRILVFDVNGRLVRRLEDTTRQAGQYVARWNGQNDRDEAGASGTYFARIIYPDGSTAEQKMTVLR